MKLEVGMYVRTFEGKIFKIQYLKDDFIYVLNTECYFRKSLYGGDYCFNFPNENDYYTITKASHNIIDLIKIGDYVNGYKVSFKGNDYQPFVQCDYPVECGQTNHYRFYEKAIYSIVTKEQFKNMEYRIGE